MQVNDLQSNDLSIVQDLLRLSNNVALFWDTFCYRYPSTNLQRDKDPSGLRVYAHAMEDYTLCFILQLLNGCLSFLAVEDNYTTHRRRILYL
jgi:hypothetical protein